MNNTILSEELNDMKYLFGYKPGKVISEQSHHNIDKKRPERLVKHNKTGKIVGTHKHGVGFHPSPYGEKLGYEFHPTDIPHGTRLGGTEIDDFEYDDADFIK
jgi:hypothetical protein